MKLFTSIVLLIIISLTGHSQQNQRHFDQQLYNTISSHIRAERKLDDAKEDGDGSHQNFDVKNTALMIKSN